MSINREIAVLQQINGKSSYLANYYFSAKYNDLLFMDYYAHSLGQFVSNQHGITSLNTILDFILQICHAIKFLIQNKIVHLDLKPSNILLSDDLKIKLIDFGNSYCESLHEKIPNVAYTYPYSDPSVITADKSKIQFMKTNADVYSIGAIISELVFKKPIIDSGKLGKIPYYVVKAN